MAAAGTTAEPAGPEPMPSYAQLVQRSWGSALAAARGCADCGWGLARRGLAEHAHLAPPELLLLALGALGWTALRSAATARLFRVSAAGGRDVGRRAGGPGCYGGPGTRTPGPRVPLSAASTGRVPGSGGLGLEELVPFGLRGVGVGWMRGCGQAGGSPGRGDPRTDGVFEMWGNRGRLMPVGAGQGGPGRWEGPGHLALFRAGPKRGPRSGGRGRGGLWAQKPPAPCASGPCGARPDPERGSRSTRRRSGLVRGSREEAGAARSLPRACLESAPPSDLGRQRPGLPGHAGGRSLGRWQGLGLQSWTGLPPRGCVRLAQFLASLGRLPPQLESDPVGDIGSWPPPILREGSLLWELVGRHLGP